MLLGGIDIVTAKTAFTMQRQSRIDYLLYQDNLLRPVSQQIYPAESDLPSQKCIPNEEHPSDHLPVWADFEIASRLQVARECAQAYAPPTASTSRLTKCIHTHLTRPLNRPMHELKVAKIWRSFFFFRPVLKLPDIRWKKSHVMHDMFEVYLVL